jgi:hypothetical protein
MVNPQSENPSASGRPRPTIAPCQATGKEAFSLEQTTPHIATLVERHTRFVMLLKVPSKDTASVVAALGKHVRKLPHELRGLQDDCEPRDSACRRTMIQEPGRSDRTSSDSVPVAESDC